ncbi:hypothetical protein M3G03_00435 [Aestuariimicrobium sp. p3-SID1156]|uniref:hypothetical protein n=1 Tax=Aestuariimicrobium sp. p3-SID1156 TaxID=2916038 RepID=UPI00223B7481|nr:hypothetical protein [Aestuariimicrobium sp. p3-SID1156]MCT1458024.1 hypothetical protein [Aestuariimicrobium sp. p3-SID1156]
MSTPPAHLVQAALPRCAAAAAAGLLFGVVSAGAALAAAPGNLIGDAARGLHLLAPHLGSALSRMIGSWWGWGVAPTLAALVVSRRTHRGAMASGVRGQQLWLQATAAAWAFLVFAVFAYYLADPLVGVRFDITLLGLWLVGSFVVAPVMGLVAVVGSSVTHWGTLVRVLIPLSSIVEILMLPPTSLSTRPTAWSELIGCLILIGVAALWAILAFARASHELVQAGDVAGSATVTAWESQLRRPHGGSSLRSVGDAWAPCTANPPRSANTRSLAA